jgi:small subunit ribosomal protein S17
MTQETESRRTLVGRVVSDRMDKSISVLVETREQHPLYKKYLRRSKKFHAHDADNACQVGDLVRIEECRPMSKTKTWRLVEVIERVGA